MMLQTCKLLLLLLLLLLKVFFLLVHIQSDKTNKQTNTRGNTHPPLENHYKKHVQEEESLLADGFMIEKSSRIL